ncbi:hypothetical protein PISMIDRAFT_102872 [Pisolithus microcarpus 441]|uniref:Uncharacterized protein n=1 Tax=Pisolithus microcarpus 441 TaxID=765257 RepID=A0A0C9YZH3_9AGAM|nr:hypothetical protein PISMIDRAFT_102872 [Pisolithus microcarpus 441]
MPAEKCKPHNNPLPYNRKPRVAKVKDAPATSACPIIHASHENLTLNDWLTVFAYIDSHLTLPQANVVDHFKTLPSGALIFTQSNPLMQTEGPEKIRGACE